MATSTQKKKAAEDLAGVLNEQVALESLSKAEHFFETNKTKILSVLGAIVLLALAYFTYRSLYLPRQEASAQEQVFAAQRAFDKGNYDVALNGDGNNPGFVQVADDFGSTKAGNLASYYAGICYLNKGEFQKAIDYLSDFEGNDEVVSSMALGAMGDAYTELNDMDTGIDYYKRAANNSRNEFTAPMFLFKAAMASESKGDFGGAKNLYEQIKQNHPESQQARDIDKYIDRAAAKAGA